MHACIQSSGRMKQVLNLLVNVSLTFDVVLGLSKSGSLANLVIVPITIREPKPCKVLHLNS